MKKLLIATALIGATFTSSALMAKDAPIDEWSPTANGIYASTEDSVVSLFTDENCNTFLGSIVWFDGTIHNINGVNVRMKHSGLEYFGYDLGVANSSKGASYLMSEFLNKSQVKIGDKVITAKGFTNTRKQITSECKARAKKAKAIEDSAI